VWSGEKEVFYNFTRSFWKCGMARVEQTPNEALQATIKEMTMLALPDQDKAILTYTANLTINPAGMTFRHVQFLEQSGFSQQEIHDIMMIVACFSFMNRLADGTGVTVQSEKKEFAIKLLGEEAWNKHMQWSKGE
jgi:alkylhydroperoxidase family enzyme